MLLISLLPIWTAGFFRVPIRTSDKVIGLLKMTSEKFNQTIVMITHNPEIAGKADVRIRIEDGKIAG